MPGFPYPVIFQLYYLDNLPVIIPVDCKPVQAGEAEQDHQHEKPTPENDFVKQPGILFGEEQYLNFPYQRRSKRLVKNVW